MAFHVFREPTLVRIEFFATFSPDDLEDLASLAVEVDQNGDYAPNRLVDMRQVTDVEVRFPHLHRLVEHRQRQRLNNPVKTAIVASKPLLVGYGRMFQELMSHPQIEVELFPTVEAARAWLAACPSSGTQEPSA